MVQSLPSRKAFLARLSINFLVGICLIGMALLLGMWGYHRFEGMSWLDSFANAAMILSGMGPLAPLHTASGKLFAGFYALFSGLIFILIVGIFLAPILHRFLHQFHLDIRDKDDTSQ